MPIERSAPLPRDRGWFWGLLGLLLWAPFPLASNRTFAIAILIVGSQCVLWGTLWAWRHHGLALLERVRLFRWPILLLSAFVAIPWLQLIPLPADVLAWLSPETLAVSSGVADALRISLDPNQTQTYAALSFAYWSCFIAVLLLVRDQNRMLQMAQVIVIGGVIQALLGGFLFSVGAEYRLFFTDVVHDRVKGAYVYHNAMAGYMELCLSVGIGLMIARLGDETVRHRSWRSRVAALAEFMLSPAMRLRLMLVVMVIALVLTRSRMGNTAFFAAMLIVGLLTIVLVRKSAPKTFMLIASLVVVDLLIIGSWVGVEKVVDRLQETTVATEGHRVEESIELRQEAARRAIALVEDFPVLGTGAGTFYNSYLRYRTDRPGYFDHAHNDYIEIATDFGLLGLTVLGLFVGATIFCGVRTLLQRRSSLPRGMAFGGLMAMTAILIHSFVDFNLQIPANALTLVVIMAMVWCAFRLPRGGQVP